LESKASALETPSHLN